MTHTEFRAWRKRLGLTQAEAADQLGISKSQVGNYERKPAIYPVPRYIELACAALAGGVTRYPIVA